jgi:hypothetical protein
MTAVHVVTLLEEMPVQETVDTVAELRRLELPVGTIIVNAAEPPLLAGGRISAAEIRRGLVAAGLPADRDVVAGLLTEARGHLSRRALETALREELAALDRPVVELPVLPGGVDLAGLYRLAGTLVG